MSNHVVTLALAVANLAIGIYNIVHISYISTLLEINYIDMNEDRLITQNMNINNARNKRVNLIEEVMNIPEMK